MIEVKFTDPAKEQFRSLEKNIRLRIYDKLEETKDFTGIFKIFLNSFETSSHDDRSTIWCD